MAEISLNTSEGTILALFGNVPNNFHSLVTNSAPVTDSNAACVILAAMLVSKIDFKRRPRLVTNYYVHLIHLGAVV